MPGSHLAMRCLAGKTKPGTLPETGKVRELDIMVRWEC